MEIIGILGAMPEEVEHIAAALKNTELETYAGVNYYKGTRGGRQVIVCCGGMGKANAAGTTQVLITKFGANVIIFSGVAGNMSGQIGIGDVVVGQTLCYHDGEDRMLAQSAPGTALYTADARLVALAAAACKQVGTRYIVGKIATGDRFVGDTASKAMIVAKSRPDCVEMEGAAVAQVAMRNQVPFVVLRAMSDNADTSAENLGAEAFDVSEYVKTASAIVLAMLDAL